MNQINIIKRSGDREPLNYEKINRVLMWATDGINGVSASDVAMNAHLQIFDGIRTIDIHKVLIQSACDLITEKTPNYQFVAANLTNYLLRKQLFNTFDNLPHLKDVIQLNIERGIYDDLILDKYSDEEVDKLNSYIKHDRDFNFTYAGLQQLIDKYLLKDRSTGETFETPQYMYMMIAATLFGDYKQGEERLRHIKSFYNDISKMKISLPTPIMSGVRTPNRQYSSCTLIDVGDSLNSIYSSNTAVGYYTAKRAGIGLNFGRIRAAGDKIRNGEVVHTGVIPFLKMFESTTKSCTQNGIRGGSSTTYFPFWHREIQDILVLKNNKGTDDNRVRKMDYGIQFSRLFYRRFIENGEITLFSPGDVPDLMDAFGVDNDKFDELYAMYERKTSIVKKKIRARDLMNQFIQERIGTGRMYIQNIDNANSHSSFLDKIWMSNLCTEITLPTSPLNHIDDGARIDKIVKIKIDKVSELDNYVKDHNDIYVEGDQTNTLKNPTDLFKVMDYDPTLEGKIDNDGNLHMKKSVEKVYGKDPAEIALCVLSAVNVGEVKDLADLEGICENIVRSLDFVITHQDYPVEAAKKMYKRRSVGIGITNLAYYLAKQGVTYDDKEALTIVDELMEHIQYYCIKASVQLAKEFGPCEWFHRTKYSKGILPIDTYGKGVDKLVKRKYTLDWEALRKEVLEFGMRNSTLTAIMPCESSSVVTNSTNGMEPIRSLVSVKKSKQGLLKMVVPEIFKLKNKYTTSFGMVDNKGITNIQAVVQKWVDQGISANHYYDFSKDGNLSLGEVAKDILHFYQTGGKMLYYANTNDNKTDDFGFSQDEKEKLGDSVTMMDEEDCEGGACSI